MLGAILRRSAARRIVVVLTVILGTPAGVIIAGAAPRAMATCDPDNHCYAFAYNLNTDTNWGAYGEINAHCLFMPTPNGGSLVTNEVWDVDSSRDYWEEVGIWSGASETNDGDKNWFWDDSRPGGGYNQHNSDVQANTNTTYRVKIKFGGGSTWYLYGNGDYSQFGTSRDQSANLITNQAGTEYSAASDFGMRNQGQVGNLQRISDTDAWFNWGDNTARYWNGYIEPGYIIANSTVNWTGPC